MLITDLERYITNRKGVIHVGGHEGEERFWYNKMGFKSVVWFEPIKDKYEILEENIKHISPPQIAYNFGISEVEGKHKFHIANNGQSSSLLEFGTHAKNHPNVKFINDIEIECIRLDTFCKNSAYPDFYNFLNIDTQGTELSVIKSLGEYIKDIDYIYTEVNTEEVYKGCALLSEIDEYLSKYGFIRIALKMTKANWGDAFYKKY